jgi:hypothetical protein
VRFLGTGSSAFSLSSLDISSLLRFFARVVFVAFAYAGVGFVGLGAGADLGRSSEAKAGAAADIATAFVGAAFRVLRMAGAGAVALLVGAAVLAVVVVAGADCAVAGAAALRSSRSVVWRVTTGMRFTRRSRRDCNEAH